MVFRDRNTSDRFLRALHKQRFADYYEVMTEVEWERWTIEIQLSENGWL